MPNKGLLIKNLFFSNPSNKLFKFSFIAKRISFADSVPTNPFLWQSKRFLSSRIFSSLFLTPTNQNPSSFLTPLARKMNWDE